MQIPRSWAAYMPDSMNRIVDSIEREVAAERESGISVYPPENLVYKALELTSPTDVRCVIIGQDPYHGEGQAMEIAKNAVEDNFSDYSSKRDTVYNWISNLKQNRRGQ